MGAEMSASLPPEESFFADLLNATYWFDDAFQVNLEAMGFERTSRAESFVLLNIAGGEQRAIEIARNLGMSRQAISQILQEFESRGWITVAPDPTDRRARIVGFSESFAERGEMCSQIINGIVRELEDRIGKPMVDAIRAAVGRRWGDPPRLNLARPATLGGPDADRSGAASPRRPARLGSPTARPLLTP